MPTISGFSRPVGCALIPGGPVGEHEVPGALSPGDTLLSVEHITEGTPPTRVDRTAEFSITAGKAGVIENTTTDTTGDFLHVLWARSE
ncbi:hypothetical protein H2509_13505 [Stappia sp. F7233]|uniref:Uncharacterized protein n=1 Tax=Stappia albiluteola TaxID=2758565 RepID=A0A839AFD9_9HYPH|nr:hypothetical protein [Stappia albiluteola]MBA5777469.1 hypothetical protein [Stappia albiluteola]MBA5777507.1 hypothetical protein [Stappia albiluteola]MBA5778082.1 hypothetical protein [Stappia albiluteola]MBA5778141.1 hypothetical protein [Stappia albiluteola]